MSKCPICMSEKYKDIYYSEEIWGTRGIVEEHSSCPRCGYRVEMCYSEPFCGFPFPKRKGGRNKLDGHYYPKDIRHVRRMERKYGIKHTEDFDTRYAFTYLI